MIVSPCRNIRTNLTALPAGSTCHGLSAEGLPTDVDGYQQPMSNDDTTQTGEDDTVNSTVYRILDAEGSFVGEGQFASFEVANAWCTGQHLESGWTLFEQVGSEWVAARRDLTNS